MESKIDTNPFEPRHNEISRHVTSGILNSGILQVVKTLCQFGSVIFLSRLLLPSDFGIVAMTGPVVGILALFQDLGLNQATVQKRNLTHAEVNAFFWINVAAGSILAIILIVISPLVGWFYSEPRVVALTAAVGFQMFVSGLGNQQSAILQRRMEFGILAFLGTLGALGGLIAAIIWALVYKDFWAIYVGSVVGTVLPIIGLWMTSGWRPSAPGRVRGLGHMFKFGAGITTSNITAFISRNTDNLLIGRRWGDQQLGLYDRAYKLLLFPLQRIVDPMSDVMIPVLSRLTEEPARYRSVFLRAMGQLALATWPGILWAIILAHTVIPTLLGEKWTGAIPMFIPLAMAGLLQVINSHAGWLFISQGRAGDIARMGIFTAVTSVLAFVIGLPYGAVGVAIAYSISEYLRAPLLWWYVTRSGPVRFADIGRTLLPQIVGTVASYFVLIYIKQFQFYTDHWTILIGGLILSYLASTLAMLFFPAGRQTLRESMELAFRTSRHVRGK